MTKKIIWSKNKKEIIKLLEHNYQYVFTDIPFIRSYIPTMSEKTIKLYLNEMKDGGYVKSFKNHLGGTSYTITEKYVKRKKDIIKKR